MEAKNKQRIIGGLVLLALVAIFLPLLFHNSRPSTRLQLSGQVPTAPTKPEVQLQLPAPSESHAMPKFKSPTAAAAQTPKITQRILNTARVEAAKPQPLKQASSVSAVEKMPASVQEADVIGRAIAKTAGVKRHAIRKKAAAAPKPVEFSSAPPKAWALQVASFADRENADRLVKKLRTQGFEVYTRQNQSGGKTITRVFVGPAIDRNQLTKAQRELRKQFQLNAVIKRY